MVLSILAKDSTEALQQVSLANIFGVHGRIGRHAGKGMNADRLGGDWNRVEGPIDLHFLSRARLEATLGCAARNQG